MRNLRRKSLTEVLCLPRSELSPRQAYLIRREHDRVLSMVQQTPFCWEWCGHLDRYGYGQVKFDGRLWKAHRLVYALYLGMPPDDLVLDHLCRRRLCVYPEHLEPVTVRENTLRGQGPTAHGAPKEIGLWDR